MRLAGLITRVGLFALEYKIAMSDDVRKTEREDREEIGVRSYDGHYGDE
jgi:hypothetical protein